MDEDGIRKRSAPSSTAANSLLLANERDQFHGLAATVGNLECVSCPRSIRKTASMERMSLWIYTNASNHFVWAVLAQSWIRVWNQVVKHASQAPTQPRNSGLRLTGSGQNGGTPDASPHLSSWESNAGDNLKTHRD
ncbi:T-cell leukemia translocation-altered gene protein homolog isoform X1 [Oryzias latipes]